MKKSFLIETIRDTFTNIESIVERLHTNPYLSNIVDSETEDFIPMAAPENFNATNLRSVIDFGFSGLDKIKKGKNKNITKKELTGLAAIVMLEARPAISITNNKFSEPPVEWKILNNHRKKIQSNFLSVGCININGTQSHIGTGFLVSEDIIMTNKHVVRKYITKKNGKWIFKLKNTNTSIDYGKDLANNHNLYSIDKVIDLHPTLDLALLHGKSENNTNLPKPLKISKNLDINKSLKRKIYIIGYPQKILKEMT